MLCAVGRGDPAEVLVESVEFKDHFDIVLPIKCLVRRVKTVKGIAID